MTFGALLSSRLAVLGWRKSELHRRLFIAGVWVSPSAIRLWAGDRGCCARDAYRPTLARVLGVSLEEIHAACVESDLRRVAQEERERLEQDSTPVAVAS